MNPKEHKSFLRWCMLGAIGGLLMAAGDWLLGCIPIQETDTGMFQRAYYLSGEYALWRPVLIVALGAIGSFLYSFICAVFSPSRSRWQSISGRQLWHGSPRIWVLASGKRLSSRRSLPIRTICSFPFCRCIFRWCFSSGFILRCCSPEKPGIPGGCSCFIRSLGTFFSQAFRILRRRCRYRLPHGCPS